MTTVTASLLDVPADKQTAEDLYLDLLKGCLSRSIFGERYKPLFQPRVARGWRKLWWHVAYPGITAALSRGGLELVRKARFDAHACASGNNYYHSEAESMIGLVGLSNVQYCVTDCLRRGVPGDLMEAGVWRGGATILMRAVLKLYGETQRRVWVADSFEGCPKPREEAEKGDRHWENNFIAVGLEQVKDNFRRYGLLDGQVVFLKGWFCDTLPNAPVERLAVLRVDGDMYSSTMDVLRAMYHRVSPGGYVIVDDYYTIDNCRKAVDEFRAERGISNPVQRVDFCRAFWQV
jgi:O-methyltransferase